MLKKIGWSFLLFFLFFGQLIAQSELQLRPSEYDVELIDLNVQEEKGRMMDFLQDSKGNIWILSVTGLHVFDGYQTLSYTYASKQFTLDSESKSPHIFSFSMDDQDLIYLQTTSEIIVFDTKRRTTKTIHPNNPGPGHIFRGPLISANQGANYFIIDQQQVKEFKFVNEKEIKSLGRIHIEKKIDRIVSAGDEETTFSIGNKLYFALPDSLYEFDIISKTLNKIKLDEGAYYKVPGDPNLIYVNNDQRLFSKFNIQQQQSEPLFKFPPTLRSKFFGIVADEEGVYYTGFHAIDADQKIYYDLTPSIRKQILQKSSGSLADDVCCLKKMQDGKVGLLTSGNFFIIKKKTPNSDKYQEMISGLEVQPSMRGLTEDAEGNVYVTFYDAGLAVKKKGGNHFEVITLQDPIINKMRAVFHLNYWKNHLLWNQVKINLTDWSVSPLVGKKFEGYTDKSHFTHCIQEDTLWMFQWYTSTLIKTDLNTNKSTTFPLDWPGDPVESYIEIVNGIVAGAPSNELYFLQGWRGLSTITKSAKHTKDFYVRESHHTNNFAVHDLLVKDTILWMADFNGLVRLDQETDSLSIKQSNYLDNNNMVQNRIMYSILEDSIGNFYIGTNRGLLYYDLEKDQLSELPEDHPLATFEFNRASKFVDRSGRYYFGTTTGLYSFLPEELIFKDPQPNSEAINLVSVSYFDQDTKKHIYQSKNLDILPFVHLKPKQNNLALVFSCINFEDDLYYSYRLLGAGNEWSTLNANPTVNFNYLAPGNHTLQIRVNKRDVNISSNIKEIKIKVDQVWYKKWFVIPLLFLFLSAFVFAYFRYQFHQRIKEQERINTLRNKISHDLHDDVGSILTGMAMQSEVIALGQQGEDKEAINDIAQMGRQAIERMRDIVWAMDSSKDKFQNLVDRMHEVAIATLRPLGIKYKFEHDGIELSNFVAPNKRKEIHLIFKEALTNITKHSNAAFVNISFVKKEDGQIEFIIADNGTHVAENKGDGVGLASMKKRAKNIGGELFIEQVDGFCVRVLFDPDDG